MADADKTAQPQTEDVAQAQQVSNQPQRSEEQQKLYDLEKEVHQKLKTIEHRIYNEEQKYITDTLGADGTPGNIVSGWEVLEGKTLDRKKAAERMFSDTSVTWSFIKKDLDRKKAEEEARSRGVPLPGALPPQYRPVGGPGAGPGASYPPTYSAIGGAGVMGGTKVDKRAPIAGKAQQGAAVMPARPSVGGVKRPREEGGVSESATPVPDALEGTPLPDVPKESNGGLTSQVGAVEMSMAGALEGVAGGVGEEGSGVPLSLGRATRGQAKKG